MIREITATEIPAPRPTHLCAKCGAYLTEIQATENAKPHRCDGDYGWLDSYCAPD